MLQLILKYAISAGLVVGVSEVSKRTGYLGGLLASLPLVSYLAIIWLYVEERNVTKVATLSFGVFWFVLPTLPFFLILPWLLKRMSFPAAMALATLALFLCYAATMWGLDKAGIQLT
ncbi:MAG: DUF3147 family protein [Planctomycetota bacterium]|nr:DUF3147 family protein [Planctomycetota bacterium]